MTKHTFYLDQCVRVRRQMSIFTVSIVEKQFSCFYKITQDHYDLTLVLICSTPCNKSCPVSFSISVGSCGTETGDVISVVEILEQ